VIRIRTGERNRDALKYADDIDEQREKSGETIGIKPGAAVNMDDILAYTE